MITVHCLGPIGNLVLEIKAANLAEVADQIRLNETIRPWLETCAVAVNDTLVTALDMPLKDGDRVSLLPPVCGG